MKHAVALSLVAIGCGVVALSLVSAVLVRGDMFVRLHFVTPVTSLGVPIVAVGLCIESGQPWVIAEVLVIAVMLLATGPVLEAATGHAEAQRRGMVQAEQPE